MEQAYAEAGGHYAAMPAAARRRQALIDSREFVTDLLRGGVTRGATQQTVESLERVSAEVADLLRMMVALERLFAEFVHAELATQPALAAELVRLSTAVNAGARADLLAAQVDRQERDQ